MPDMICSAGQDASPLTGMVPMYLLMSAFHLAPWLRAALSSTKWRRINPSEVSRQIAEYTARRNWENPGL